jgi:hypothetical protein
MTHKCFNCGFETSDKALFLAEQSGHTHHWTIFRCPQCTLTNPPVAEIGLGPPAFEEPIWFVVESNKGIYIKYMQDLMYLDFPIHRRHQLANAPASLLRPGLKGTILDHSHKLQERGEARSEAFKAESKAIRKKYRSKLAEALKILPPGSSESEALRTHPVFREREAKMDEAFAKYCGEIHDHIEHDGSTLMKGAGRHHG